MVSFVPTFTKDLKVEKVEIEKGGKPEADEVVGFDNKFLFIFIVDRSGSMWGDRIKMTVEALKLFLKSLPDGCMFDIVSFGTIYKSYTKTGVEYNEKT